MFERADANDRPSRAAVDTLAMETPADLPPDLPGDVADQLREDVEAAFEARVERELAGHLTQLLGEAPAGGVLAAAVEDASDGSAGALLADLSDDAVVSLYAAGLRLAAWATSRSVRAAAELGRRWQTSRDGWGDPEGPVDPATWSGDLGHRAAAQELALASSASLYAAEGHLDVGLHLPARLPGVAAAFEAGELDWAKVREIWSRTRLLGAQQAAAVEAAVLPAALTMTLPQLREALIAAVVATDPEAADRAAARAHTDRAVRVRPGDDGSATLTLTAGAADIAAADAGLTALAAAARTEPTDDRDHLATKADVLLDLIHRAAENLDGPCLDTEGDAHDTPEKASNRSGGGGPTGRQGMRTIGGTAGRTAGRTEVVVTVPLSTILRLTETPGYLRGIGPVPPGPARELAEQVARNALDGHWRCAVTDDRQGATHGTLLALGRSTFSPRYTPPAATTRFVTTRDGTCVFPGCRRTADACDVDHRTPYRRGGVSCDCNLQALCRTHHRLKHHGHGFRVEPDCTAGTRVDAATSLTWTTPTGRSYPRDPRPLPHAPVPCPEAEPPPF